MRINILILAVTILLGAGLTFWLDGASSNAGTNTPDKIATEETSQEKLPDFSFTDISGKSHDIKDFEDQVILINFWATWCAPCVVEFPKLIQLAKDHPDIVIVALSSDINDDKIKQFLIKNPVSLKNFIVARDVKRKITTDLFQTYKLPETIIVSPSGKIVRKIVGDTDWGGKDIQNLLISLQK